MKELEFFETKIANIINKNEINNFYLFAETILEQEKKYGSEEIMKKFNLDNDDLFCLKIYSDALKIGDFNKDVFKEFNLEKISELDEISLNDCIKKAQEKYEQLNYNNQSNLIDSINN